MRVSDRLKNVRQERRTLSANAFVGLLLVLVVLIASFLFVNSTYFSVGSVTVEGNKYISTEEVYRIAGIPDKINIFRLNTTEIKSRLMNDLRVSDVEVVRHFPASIGIKIKERKPLAYVASGYGFIQIDKQGVVLAAFKSLKQMNVPIITGIRLGSVYVGDKVDNPQINNILNYLNALDEQTLNQLSEVNIKSPEQIMVYTTSSVHIRIGNGERLAEKARLTSDILRETSDKKMAIEYIDLNYATPFIKIKQ